MSDIAIEVCNVWKKFRKGEIHDSLRDFLPALARRLVSRNSNSNELGESEFWALKDVSFQVRRGEALGIIGPNGAGKSTLLKILSRILRPNRGHYRVNGQLRALIDVGAGFHNDLTGRENIYLNGSILGMTKRDIDRRLDEIIDFSGIEPFIDTPIKRYSSGMRARLGFSIMAHMDPEILLVDEVLSVGDITFQGRCLEKMSQKLHSGVAVIFVSHNLQAVVRLCDRALVLNSGSSLFDGPPAQALNLYMKAAQTSSTRHRTTSPQFELTSVEFRQLDGKEAHTISPHTSCELVVTFECLNDVPPFNVGIEFERTRDLFYCYGTTTQELGYSLLRLTRGEVFTLRYHFTAHFARGHYRVNVNIRDSQHAQFLQYAESVANFSIHEDVTYDGVVDVGMSVEIHQGQKRESCI